MRKALRRLRFSKGAGSVAGAGTSSTLVSSEPQSVNSRQPNASVETGQPSASTDLALVASRDDKSQNALVEASESRASASTAAPAPRNDNRQLHALAAGEGISANTAEAAVSPADSPNVNHLEKDSYGMQVIYSSASIVIDIVFIHGLTGSAYTAWFHEQSGVHWPRDFLGNDLRDARIMTFGYDADVVNFWKYAAQDGVSGYANNLLGSLASCREGISDDRKIIFVAHSLGGLVIQRALTISRESRFPHLRRIEACTVGICFLGTPHHGTDLATWRAILTAIANITEQVNRSVKLLKRGSEILMGVQDSFYNVFEERKHEKTKINIIYFYELLPVAGSCVVPKESATMSGERNYPIRANHIDMTKFSKPEDQGYQIILHEIQRLSSAVSSTSIDSVANEDDKKCLYDFRLTYPPDDKLRIKMSEGYLLNDSYTWILDDAAFRNWHDGDGTQLLWINGGPGTGKTMLMIGLIAELSRRLESEPGSGILSYFFCQSTDSRLNNVVSVLRGLIYLLVDQQKTLVQHLRQRYDPARRQFSEDIDSLDALRTMLFDILHDSSLARVYLMVDALDECDIGFLQLLDLITYDSKPSSRIKWLVASRNLPNIEKRLRPNNLCLEISLELNSSHISRAVNAFIDFKVEELAERNGHDGNLLNELKDVLRKKAEGTFLWTGLVCKQLQQLPPWETQSALERLPPGIEPLYQRMLHEIQQKNAAQLCIKILRLVTLAFRPIHLRELGATADLPETLSTRLLWLNQLVGLCSSFLTVREETVYFVHHSAKDFFSTGKGSQIFPFGQAEEHREIAYRSLRIMSETLRTDICDLKMPGTLLDELDNVSHDSLAHIQYACCYWVSHLRDASLQDQADLSDDGIVSVFLRKHFLHWLEALGLMGYMSDGVNIVRTLESILKHNSNTAPQLLAIVQDAKRFICHNRSLIERAPLQVYASALLFSPKASLIRRLFLDAVPRWIMKCLGVDENWSPTFQTLEGHLDYVRAVAFSPSGQRLASASDDRTVRLWDPETGVLQQTLEGHSDYVRDVTFSPDGRWLASASDDWTVRLWDPETGVLQQTLEGHSDYIQAVKFSSDGRLLASASSKIVQLWDIETEALSKTLEGHSDYVRAVAFSPDERQLASASDDSTVRLWDPKTGALLQILKGHSDCVRAVVFSPDGRWLASASDDKIVQLWDAKTGVPQHTLQGHSDYLQVAFSPDGRRLASASSDKIVRLWEAETGVLQQTLKGHSDYVRDVTFSPDGRRLASASDDKTVRLWDPETEVQQQTHEGHSDYVLAVTFSPNGRQLATASADNTVRLWDIKTGALQQTLEGHSDYVQAVAFSPDGRQLASASDDWTVRLWDPETGVLQRTLEGHLDYVQAVAFSPDGRRLASASSDKIVRLWEAETGVLQQTLEGHSDYVRDVTFSPDGRQLASASDDKTVRVWDAETGVLQQTFIGHSDYVQTVTFSTDGRQLASASADKTVRLWDAKTGASQHALKNKSGTIKVVAFSPDGQWLITNQGSIDLATLLSSYSQTAIWSSYSLDWDRSWIRQKGHRLLWLPPEYRPTCQMFRGNVLAMGHSSGQVTIIEFQ